MIVSRALPPTGLYAGSNSLYPNAKGPIWSTATLQAGGKVLLVGSNPAEIYDPITGTFRFASRPMASHAFLYGMYWHTTTLLRDGRALVAGGTDDFWVYSSADLFDPVADGFHEAGNMNVTRTEHSSTLLPDGTVLIAGGSRASFFTAEVFDPETRAFTPTGDMITNRAGHTATLLKIVLNWQRGPKATHHVPQGIASGDWTVHGVRPHQLETDHTGDFSPVSATIRVAP